jgi:Spy/CpxP family protein refolding chaperone
MKKISYLALAAFVVLMAAACSSTPAGPGAAMKEYYEALIKGDYEKFAEGVKFKDADTPEKAAEQKEGIVSMLKEKMDKAPAEKKPTAIEIVSEEIAEDGNSAKVNYKVTLANGNVDEDDQQMVKVDGKWLMQVDK